MVGGMSERNINPGNVSKELRTCASSRGETDGREFDLDSLMDWHPVHEEVEKQGSVLMTLGLAGLHCFGGTGGD